MSTLTVCAKFFEDKNAGSCLWHPTEGKPGAVGPSTGSGSQVLAKVKAGTAQRFLQSFLCV